MLLHKALISNCYFILLGNSVVECINALYALVVLFERSLNVTMVLYTS